MQFILATWDKAVAATSGRLVKELASGRRVLWLFSGGSNVKATVQIMQLIPDDLSAKLSVMAADERYGPVGHADSNWAQLMSAGFEAKNATLLPGLKEGLDFDATAVRYEDLAAQTFNGNDVIIGQLGIGPDGHTAGILPDSPACHETDKLVAHYEAAPLRRLTLTFAALGRINAAYVLAYGENKRAAVTALKDQQLPLKQQPAQILKTLKEAYVYNDLMGNDQ